ncbi:MAG: hypothetical protein FGM24_00710 [Candidatus Kapabacteria bacterium]|nr:hypothetical protein [Candidatus Kapabacteria bacterium]
MSRHQIFVALLMIVGAFGCSAPEPKAISYGKDQCAACKMGVSDSKFGAEAVMSTGKTYVFDSPECMIDFVESKAINSNDVHSLWVTDFVNPGTLIDARSAWYLQSDMIRSPMGLNAAAFTTQHDAERARINYVGTIHRYDDVVKLVME